MSQNRSTVAITGASSGWHFVRGGIRGFVRFNRGVLRLPLPLQGWVLLLVGANLVAPIFFFAHTEARVIFAAGAAGMMLMTMLTARFGFSRIVGLGHIMWVPLLVYLWGRFDQVPVQGAFGLWLRAVILLDGISLLFDGADVLRYFRGERGETVTGLDAAAEASRG